jgi:predicted peroxiredoxin
MRNAGGSVPGMADSLVIEVTCFHDAPERCRQAFTVAAAACAADVAVEIWLSGEGAWLARPGKAAELDLGDLLDLVVEMGRVTLCTESAARREITPDDLLAGVTIAGAATYVERLLREGTQALVY